MMSVKWWRAATEMEVKKSGSTLVKTVSLAAVIILSLSLILSFSAQRRTVPSRVQSVTLTPLYTKMYWWSTVNQVATAVILHVHHGQIYFQMLLGLSTTAILRKSFHCVFTTRAFTTRYF